MYEQHYGKTATWHSVTAVPGKFRSLGLSTKEKKEITNYMKILHITMTGV